MSSALLELLPQHEGLLPKWLLFVSFMAVGNSIQSTLTKHFNLQIYNGKPTEGQFDSPVIRYQLTESTVTGVSSRTFAIWTLLSGIIRAYGAYYIDNKQIYEITFWTYVLAFLHFGSEFFIYKTAKYVLFVRESGMVGANDEQGRTRHCGTSDCKHVDDYLDVEPEGLLCQGLKWGCFFGIDLGMGGKRDDIDITGLIPDLMGIML